MRRAEDRWRDAWPERTKRAFTILAVIGVYLMALVLISDIIFRFGG